MSVGYAPLEFDPIVMPLVRGVSVLDLGCGYGHWGHLLRTHYRPTASDRPARVVGVDIHAGNIAFCQGSDAYDALFVADVVDFLAGQPAGAFETVIAVELIEHLPRQRGEQLLAEIVRVARQVAILSTPNWEYLRPGREGLTGFNEHEHHLSRWRGKDFRQHGFTVRGVGHKVRWWPVRGVNRLLNTLPTLDLMLAAWAHRHPALAMHLIAFRNV